ncbi:hypothetical protein MNBD_ALPHA09-1766 [hydrothermal vent metagenome]|uniref:Peptidoglycan binding-like domain-containing protein n=1 Tax=hydrothermal vent metagenome TaxID=652676 RepID=A0A3B0T9Q2_9ZZZZ
MRLRVAEFAGSTIVVLSGAAFVWALVFDPPYPLPSEPDPVRHLTDGTAGKAFENDKTARLALARFPLPVDGEAQTSETAKLIKSLQIELARHGLDVGPADGTVSPKTREAIAVYQRQMSLEVTGQPSQLLLDHLEITQPLREASSTPENSKMIRLVATVQKQLASLGYSISNPNGVVTGETRDAIAKFERETGLPVTGEVSFKLVQRLNRFEYTPL